MAIGGAIVTPQGLLDELASIPEEGRDLSPEERAKIDRMAVEAVVASEQALGRTPIVVTHNNEGYDIESTDSHEPMRLRFIEVKGK